LCPNVLIELPNDSQSVPIAEGAIGELSHELIGNPDIGMWRGVNRIKYSIYFVSPLAPRSLNFYSIIKTKPT
jgi:hypothetical protein